MCEPPCGLKRKAIPTRPRSCAGDPFAGKKIALLLMCTVALPSTAAAEAADTWTLRAFHGPLIRAALATKKFWPVRALACELCPRRG